MVLNQFATFLSCSFIVSKNDFLAIYWMELEINKFLLSASISGVSLLELMKNSFIYMRNKSGQEWSPAVHHK